MVQFPWWFSSPSGTRECTVPSNRSRRKILGRLLSAISQKKEISAWSSLSALFPISALPQRYQKSLMRGFDKHYQNKTRMLAPPPPPPSRAIKLRLVPRVPKYRTSFRRAWFLYEWVEPSNILHQKQTGLFIEIIVNQHDKFLYIP